MALISIGTIWMDRIFLFLSILNALVLLSILSYQLYKNRSKSTRKQLNHKQIRLLNVFSIGTLLFTVVYGVQRSISGQGIGDCTLHVFLGGFFWLTSKLCMYLFFISRLDVAFRHSSFRFSNKLFVFLYILVVIAWITQVLQYAIWGKGILVNSQEFNITFCGNLSPLFTFIYLACCDFCISSTLSFLFVKRLFSAFYFTHTNKSEVDQKSLAKVIREMARYVTLTIVGVCTTIMALLVFGTTSWFSAIALDLMINNHCIFMMYGSNKKYFNFVCGPFHRLIGKCFVCCVSGGDQEFGDEVIRVYEVTHHRAASSTNTLSETDPERTKTSLKQSSAADLTSPSATEMTPRRAEEELFKD